MNTNETSEVDDLNEQLRMLLEDNTALRMKLKLIQQRDRLLVQNTNELVGLMNTEINQWREKQAVINDLSERESKLQVTVIQNQNVISNLTEEVDKLKMKMSDLEREHALQLMKVEQKNNTISQETSQFQTQVLALQSNVDELEKELNDYYKDIDEILQFCTDHAIELPLNLQLLASKRSDISTPMSKLKRQSARLSNLHMNDINISLDDFDIDALIEESMNNLDDEVMNATISNDQANDQSLPMSSTSEDVIPLSPLTPLSDSILNSITFTPLPSIATSMTPTEQEKQSLTVDTHLSTMTNTTPSGPEQEVEKLRSPLSEMAVTRRKKSTPFRRSATVSHVNVHQQPTPENDLAYRYFLRKESLNRYAQKQNKSVKEYNSTYDITDLDLFDDVQSKNNAFEECDIRTIPYPFHKVYE